jgi:hypothetical protein
MYLHVPSAFIISYQKVGLPMYIKSKFLVLNFITIFFEIVIVVYLSKLQAMDVLVHISFINILSEYKTNKNILP